MIDYSLINDSINYYQGLGYKRIESPWTVTKNISNITKPKNAKDFELKHENNKVLVASGEQSLLYLYNKGFLPNGCFQTVTPCFRSDSFDSEHTKYFIKNELIITVNVSESAVDKIVDHAFKFFVRNIKDKNRLHILQTDETYSFDILLDTKDKLIELGSYGIRSCSFLKWVYGTGIAEPRFSRYKDYI